MSDRYVFVKMLLPIIVVSFISRIGANIYLPAVPDMAKELAITDAQAAGTVSIYFLTLSIACLVVGAVSDFYNKKSLLLWASLLIVAGSLLCGFANTLIVITIGRAIQALGGATIIVTSQTWLGQASQNKSMVQVFAYFSLALSIAPLSAPIIGGFVTDTLSWRYTFFLLAVMTIVAALSIRNSKSQGQYPTKKKRELSLKGSLSSYLKLLISPSFVPIVGSSLLCYFFQGGFLAYSSFLFIDELKMDPTMYGAISIPIVGGLILGRFPTIYIEKRKGIVATYKFNSAIMVISMLFSVLFYAITGHHTTLELLVAITVFNIGFSGHVILSLSNAMTIFIEQKGQVSATINFLNQSSSYVAALLVQILFSLHISSMANYNIFAMVAIVMTILLYFSFRSSYSRYLNKSEDTTI